MCIIAEQLEQEPIVLVTFDCILDQRLPKQLAILGTRYGDCFREPYDMIADVRAMDSAFFELFDIMQETDHEAPGTVFRPNLKNVIFVGTPAIVQEFRSKPALTESPVGIRMVESINEALEIAHTDPALVKIPA